MTKKTANMCYSIRVLVKDIVANQHDILSLAEDELCEEEYLITTNNLNHNLNQGE